MDLISYIHLTFAITGLLSGLTVLIRKKGDVFHTWLGKIFVASMILVNLTAFAFWPEYGFTFFQPLAVLNLVWVLLGYYYAVKKPHKKWLTYHYYFFTYAYLGVLAAATARIPIVLGLSLGISTLIAMVAVFGIGAYFIEKNAKKIAAISV
ncbi:DUF2306 domain-containing protein [Aurantivibrio infirmus]